MNGFNQDPGTPHTFTTEQVDFLPGRIFDIMVTLQEGYGLDGNGPKEGSVAYGQMMLGELLKDLDIDLPALGFEVVTDDWTFGDLPRYALLAAPAISAAPNLTHEQKTKLLSQYPTLLINSGFAWTSRGGKSQVLKKLKSMKRGGHDAETDHQRLISDIERVWCQERFQRTLGFVGSIAAKLKK